MSSTSGFAKIVVPVDGSEQSMRAAETAVRMAAKYGSSLVAIHIVNLDQYLQSLGLYRLSYPEPVKKRLEEAQKEAQDWFSRIRKVAEENHVRMESRIIDSSLSTVAAIIEFAENDRADLIVIGTRGRTGFSKLLLGSVANGVVTYATCPVLVVR